MPLPGGMDFELETRWARIQPSKGFKTASNQSDPIGLKEIDTPVVPEVDITAH